MSETNELEALLRRWADLAPNECRIFDKQGIAVLLSDGDMSPYLDQSDVTDRHVIQGAVQVMIGVRGWPASLEYYMDPIREEWVWRATVRAKNTEAYKQRPAEALLSAYLATIEATTP